MWRSEEASISILETCVRTMLRRGRKRDSIIRFLTSNHFCRQETAEKVVDGIIANWWRDANSIGR